MQLTIEGGRWVALSTYNERHIPKAAGFRWDPDNKVWYSTEATKAGALAEFATPKTKAALDEALGVVAEAQAASAATDTDVEIPVPAGLSYLPYQRAGIAYAAGRPASLIADEMGLGKTIQAVGVINADASIKRVLVVCPASLKLNWQRELRKWLCSPLSVEIANGKGWPKADIVVVNYDVLHKFKGAIDVAQWDLLIVDEAHYLKNPKARRTKMVLGYRGKAAADNVAPIAARRRVFLTGTPIVNRPVELWPLVNSLDPATFGSFWSYAKRYTNARHNGWGWDFTGHANLDELQDLLRAKVMVRRLKKDVLTDLPAKRRQVIEIPASTRAAKAAVKAEWDAYKRLMAHGEGAGTIQFDRISVAPQVAFDQMARVRHETALAKAPLAAQLIVESLDDNDEPLVVMGHHKDALALVREEIEAAGHRTVLLTGDQNADSRQQAVDDFQSGRARVFLGTIGAAGVGITLTRASRVVFVELDWVPGNVTQAEDRCHRIGQTESVLIQHLVLEESFDLKFVETLIRKQEVIDEALDSDTTEAREARAQAVAEAIEAAEELMAREAEIAQQQAQERALMEAKLAERAAQVRREIEEREAAREAKMAKLDALPDLTDEQIDAVMHGLQTLVGYCDGAHKLDDMGFNKMHARAGRELAGGITSQREAKLGQQMVRFYRRQLDNSTLAAAGIRV